MQNQFTYIKLETEIFFSGIFLRFCFARTAHNCPPEQAGAGPWAALGRERPSSPTKTEGLCLPRPSLQAQEAGGQ